MKVCVHAIHGFLGSPKDWLDVMPVEVASTVLLDLFEGDPESGSENNSKVPVDLEGLGHWVNHAQRNCPNRNSTSVQHILVGYSLGGRVALHALIADPSLWDAGIILGGHVGLKTDAHEERALRWKQDQTWANRFRHRNSHGNSNDTPDSVLRDWNAQPILSSSNPPRDSGAHALSLLENPRTRERVAQVMEGCSLARQKDLRPNLGTLTVPITWVSGENDRKFCELHSDVVKLNPLFGHQIISGAGHRVLIDQPDSVKRVILQSVQSARGQKGD